MRADRARAPSSPFDALAARYDETFTATPLGVRLRRAVWRHLDRAFFADTKEPRLLDIGCGTGEDAVHLAARGARVVAVDAADAMVRAAREKARRLGLAERVSVKRVAAERLFALRGRTPFDGVVSNFGALNCVESLPAISRSLAPLVCTDAPVFLCLMGRLCPWEWAYYLARGEPRKAFRRLSPGGSSWRGLRIRYPSVATACEAFAPEFRFVRARAVGALLPPTYLEDWAARNPRVLDRLDAWERRLEDVWPLPHLGDHVLLELRRR